MSSLFLLVGGQEGDFLRDIVVTLHRPGEDPQLVVIINVLSVCVQYSYRH